MRENGEYIPSDDELDHIQAVLYLLNVFDKDHRFETVINENVEAKEVRTMSEWLTKVIDTSKNEAIETENLINIRRAMEKQHLTEDEAMDYMDIIAEERPKYQLLLQESST